jgi:hypothetical protein
MKRIMLVALFAVLISSSITYAQVPGKVVGTQCWINGKLVGGFPAGYTCPGTGGGNSPSSGYPGTYAPMQQAIQQATTNFITWLFSSGSAQAESQKQQMMWELQRRQAEAERLHQVEEAQQLAAMYNRLRSTMKLSGLPNLQMKDAAGNGAGLRLKIGESNGQTGIKGLPGIYLNDGKTPYGIPGLPGIYTGGSGQGSGLTNSRLALKTGESQAGVTQVANSATGLNQSDQSSTVGGAPALANESGLRLKTGDSNAARDSQPTMLDPSKMTPQQLADVAVMVSKLPPEEQRRLLATAQNNAAAGQSVPGGTGQLSLQVPASLRQQVASSQAATAASTLEDASTKARGGFDSPAPALAPRTGPNVVDLRDKKAPYIVDPTTVKGMGQPQAGKGQMQGDEVVAGINAQAKNLGWSADKIARLNDSLFSLGLTDDATVTGDQIDKIWQNVAARGNDKTLARAASQGRGPGMPGAGKQTGNEDCAIFAVANAANLSYSVVAARAGEIIRNADWRSADDRANPQKVMERAGLNGGEVIMLAEAFGSGQVVPRSEFAKMLKSGGRILVNVAHTDGNRLVGHEVVLTKAFSRGGETWYEMMDSNQGPMKRLYVSDKELNVLILENGVVFSPEPGTVPKLLR